MSAATTARSTRTYPFGPIRLPVDANANIRAGVMVSKASPSGQALETVANVAHMVVGASLHGADNTGGADGAKEIDVWPGKCGPWNNSAAGDAITSAHIGELAYAVDNQTVALTDGSGARPVAGIIWNVDDKGVYIDIDWAVTRP